MSITVDDYLAEAHGEAKAFLRGSTDLVAFLAAAKDLRLAERRRVVEQAIVLLEQTYVHLPLKEAMHAVKPVQALRVLQDRLAEERSATMGSDYHFHREMLRIFLSVRDLHTNYILPSPYTDWVAFLPFDIERYVEGDISKYLVSHVVQGFTHPHFKEGVEVVAWNGVPIARAVEVIADRHAGSNEAARAARGVELLTQRPLVRLLPPDEAWVEVDYIGPASDAKTLRFDWRLFDVTAAAGNVDVDTASDVAASMGISLEQETLTTAKRVLFAPQAERDAKAKQPKLTREPAADGVGVPSSLPRVFRARSVVLSDGSAIGHLRIFTFSVDDPLAFVEEARRLVGLLPQDRLVIDVRSNGGGHIHAAEGLLQLFTPNRVTPEPTQFLATPLTRRLCQNNASFLAWLPSLGQAVRTGAVYSTGHPITPVQFANSIGQTYRGRVACITNALCYSATDIFAAGFQDHEIGPVIGIDSNTGAGGANVWTHSLLRDLMTGGSNPFVALPNGVAMRVSIRRTLRVGKRAGTPVEDLGVQPDRVVALTKNDLVNGNVDLLDAVGQVLNDLELRRLEVMPDELPATGEVEVTVDTDNFGRLDVVVDDRPWTSLDVRRGPNMITLPADAGHVRFEGWSARKLVISNTIRRN